MKPSTTYKFSVEVASVPDRDDLVAEVWLDQELIAELRHGPSGLQAQIYPAPPGQPWDVPYEEFTRALQEARDKLGPAPAGRRPRGG